MQVVEGFNADDRIHGVLVQLPLPKHINEKEVLDAVSLDKDVDGFHPHNIGSLALRGRSPKFVSCTPKVRSTTCIMVQAPHQLHLSLGPDGWPMSFHCHQIGRACLARQAMRSLEDLGLRTSYALQIKAQTIGAQTIRPGFPGWFLLHHIHAWST